MILLELNLLNIKLLSVNKAYNFYGDNGCKPFTISKNEKKTIQDLLMISYKNVNPCDVNKVIATFNGKGDLDNKFKTIFDASQGIVIKNDRDINYIEISRGEKTVFDFYENDKSVCSCDLSSVSNSINKHWSVKGKNSSITLTKEARKYKEDMAIISRFYKTTKIPSEKDVIIELEAGLNKSQDLDNIFKLLFDSYKRIIYDEDKQICKITAIKKIVEGNKNTLKLKVFEKE